jgi:membrane protease YdiL (CAAX protease family)
MAAGFPFGGLVLATAWWFVLFSPWTAPVVRFWWGMLFATGSLLAYSAWLLRRQWHTVLQLNWRNVLLGVTSAIVLYGIFWLGHTVLLLLAPESRDAIAAVYQRRQEAPPWLLALLLGLWIGPAEEIFWRGVLQRALQQRIHRIAALVLATALYSLVHAWSGNLPLLLAAFTAGLLWGALFASGPVRSCRASSHTGCGIFWSSLLRHSSRGRNARRCAVPNRRSRGSAVSRGYSRTTTPA